MSNKRPSLPIFIFAGALVLAIIGLTWINIRFVEQNPGGNDFLARWMGARMWVVEGINPYAPEVSLSSQTWIYGRAVDLESGEDIAHFVYPLHSMVFFAPFAVLDFPLARAVWTTLIQLSLMALPILSFRIARWRAKPLVVVGLILFSLLWYHGMRTINVGQFAGINAAMIALAILLILERRDGPAGVILALTTVKPQMVFLLMPYIVIWAWFNRRYRLFWTTVGTTLGLVIFFLLFIPSWPLDMLSQILGYPSYTSIGSPLSIVAQASPIAPDALNAVLHALAFIYLAIIWVKSFREGSPERFVWVIMMTMVITNWAAFRTATTNFVMMLPVLTLAFASWRKRWGQVGRWLSAGTLVLLFAGIWILFITTIEGNQESAWVYLPFPAIVFFMLLDLKNQLPKLEAVHD